MNRKNGKRIFVALWLCSTAFGCALMVHYVVPWMQSVQLGDGDTYASEAPMYHFSQEVDDVLLYNWTQGAGAQAEAPAGSVQASDVMIQESDASVLLHDAKPYPTERILDDGTIVETHYGIQNGTQFLNLDIAGQVRNCTDWNNTQLLAESRIAPDLPLKADGTPMVLIYHTHTTESYELIDRSGVDDSFNYRTTDPTKNMVRVGEAIAEQLSAAGIGVIHAKEIHDYPVWSGSYTRSANTIQSILKTNPSICIALDVHRDAISNDTTVYAPVAEIQGKKAAQIMIISGCDDGTLNMPEYRRNFHLASRIQQTMEANFAGLTRPILFDYRKYNQDLTHGSLLIEVGSQGNTMEEARYAGELFGKALRETILALIREREV